MQLLRNDMYPQSELDNYKLQVDLLQQKLKQSEENRQQLQKELQQILHRRSEHDKTVRSKIRQKYQSFLDEQERRNERNKMLMQMLERIDQQSAALSARSERLKMMKLQYERYFAKLMQTQPMRCIQSTGLATEVTPIAGISTTTQIPILLPAAETQQPATASVGGTPSMPTITNPTEETKANEATAAVLTPRMWTFAMATPTPAGLILTGTPTAALGATPLTTTVQYPLGYGTILQQPLQQQQQFQNFESMRFRKRFGSPHNADTEMNGKSYNDRNSYGVIDDDFPVDTRDASTATSKGNVRKDCEQFEETKNEPSTYATTSQQTDNLPGHQLDLEIKISEQAVVTGAIDSSRDINNLMRGVSEVQLEDTFDDTKMFDVSTDDFENPTMSTNFSENYDETSFRPRNFLKHEKRGPTGLQSAEEHKRKMAEIERQFGTADFGESSGGPTPEKDVDKGANYSGFKRFSEIVNSTAKSNNEDFIQPHKKTDNQRNDSWQAHTSTNNYAPKNTFSSTVATPKKISIDNIESAIYGELVTPHLDDAKAPTIRTAAQGFFTELLGEQEAPADDGGLKTTITEEAELTKAVGAETATDSAVKNNDTANLGYANYSTSIEGSESAETKAEDIGMDTAQGDRIEPQQQATYDTANTEFYPQTTAAENVYGTSELTNAYAEYATDQNIEQVPAENNTITQQGEPADYAQQGYENYDASQYENYDPNPYPGYIYDETTGQYVVDPQYAAPIDPQYAAPAAEQYAAPVAEQYAAPEGGIQEATYATQEYNEQLSQEQLDYQASDVGQDGQADTNYAYEDSTYAEVPATTDPVVATATAVVEDVAQSATPAKTPAADTIAPPPAESAPPKVQKPTSILATADKHATQGEAQKKKKRVNFVDSSETDDSSSVKVTGAATAAATLGAAGSESDFDFSSGAETSVG